MLGEVEEMYTLVAWWLVYLLEVTSTEEVGLPSFFALYCLVLCHNHQPICNSEQSLADS